MLLQAITILKSVSGGGTACIMSMARDRSRRRNAPGCTLRAGIGQGRLDWQGAGDYAWDVVEGVGLPGAMAVDAIVGTNGTQQILDDAGTGTYLGVAFTGVTTLGGLQSGGAISNAALRGQVWLTSGSRLAVGVGLVGLGLNAADEGALWLRTMQGDCAAFGEWAALQQLGAADGLLPFGDVLAAGMLLPGRKWGPSGGRPVLRGDPYHPDEVAARQQDMRQKLQTRHGENFELNPPFDAASVANKLGYAQRIPPQRAPFNSHGQPVFTNGRRYITPDIDQHNVTNGWKMFDRRGTRIGTYSPDLKTRIGD